MKVRNAASSSLGFGTFLIGWCLMVGCTPSAKPTDKAASDSIVQKSEKSGVELLVQVSPKQPRLSELVNLSLTISYPRSIAIEPPTFGQSVGDFAIRDYRQQESSSTSDESTSLKRQMVIQYQLEPMFSGRHLIRSIPIAFSAGTTTEESRSESEVADRDIVQSEPIEIEVLSEFGGSTPDLSQVSPMIEPLDAGSNGYTWWAMSAIVLVLLGAFGVWYTRGRRKQLVAESAPSPEELAQTALSQLMAEQLPSKGLVKEFYLRLTGIVRVYIEGKTGLKAPEQTTEEFLREMRSCRLFDAAHSNRLHEFLVAADLVKYAGQQPDEANIQQSVARAREFICMQFSTQDGTPSGTNGRTDGDSLTVGKSPNNAGTATDRSLQESN